MTKRLPFKWHPTVRELLVPASTVRPHPQNANNGDEDVVRESILTNGVYGPIIAQKSTGFILAGHTQYAVEVDLQLSAGVSEADVVVPVSWTQCDHKTALRIVAVDNESARMARMDDALLLQLLQELEGDLEGSGFNDDKLDALMRHLDMIDDVSGSLAGDVSSGDLDVTEGQVVLTVVIDEDHRQAFYAAMSELSYVHDVRDAR